MKIPCFRLLLPAVLSILALNFQLTVFAQGTAFTYQGQLNDSGGVANGTYDLAFSLFNVSSGGTDLAMPVTNSAVHVTNGLFTVTLDFGNMFDGTSRWVEMSVRTNGDGSFTTLSPRMELTPAPYAVFAATAGNVPGLQIQPNTNGAPNVIGGSTVNYVAPGTVGAVIAGGGATNFSGQAYTSSNTVTANFGFVGSGQNNNVQDSYSSIVGGLNNIIQGNEDVIGGGGYHTINPGVNWSVIGGGFNNLLARGSGGYSDYLAIGGGSGNVAASLYATVPGGQGNTASGIGSFAAGQNAKATNDGAFVWSDNSSATPFSSTSSNQFLIRATGGVGIGVTNPATALQVAGTVTASNFVGSGAGLTGVVSTPVATPVGMTLIPAGAFTMGDSLDGESDAIPTVSVFVSAFYMDVNLVSYSQWLSVYYWATNEGYNFGVVTAKAPNHPVWGDDWYDAVKWCNARSQQAGLTPVYYTNAGFTQVYTNGDVDTVYANWAANGYRLPTEAEWEKAARGGLSGQRFPWGNIISENLANYSGYTGDSYDLGPSGFNSLFDDGNSPYTSPVGYFAPNGYGLYDMAGNVNEWCWDWFGTPYAGGSDPHGPASGSNRVARGGDWYSFSEPPWCHGRTQFAPSFGYTDQESFQGDFGFRCVKGL